jgi:SAM-dependent methyltransferase
VRCTHLSVSNLKAEIRQFWNEAPCGEVYAAGIDGRQRFDRHAEARYRLEPYIRDFARFEQGSGRDVLELGVGMGADHLEWARNGPRRLAGIDLTPRAVAWATERLAAYGFTSKLEEADVETFLSPMTVTSHAPC